MGAAKIYSQIPKIMADIEAIGKNRKNDAQKYNFRGIDDFLNAVHPALTKHSVFIVPKVIEERGEERQSKSGGANIYRILKICFSFFADDGSSVEAVTIGEGMDSGDKAANKAMSAALKYALLQVFSIPTQDMAEADYDSHEVLPKPRSVAAPELVSKMLSAFSAIGVTRQMIEKEFGYKLDNLVTKDLDALRDVYDRIKSGKEKVSDHFAMSQAAQLNQIFKESK